MRRWNWRENDSGAGSEFELFHVVSEICEEGGWVEGREFWIQSRGWK